MAVEGGKPGKNYSPEMQAAIGYTGSEDLARRMLQNRYNDMFVIKVRFDTQSHQYGLLLLKLNYAKNKLIDVHGYVTSSSKMTKVRHIEPLAVMVISVQKVMKNDSGDLETFKRISKRLFQYMNEGSIRDLITACSKNNLAAISNLIGRIISNPLNVKKLIVQVDVEDTNSFSIYHKIKDLKILYRFGSEEIVEADAGSSQAKFSLPADALALEKSYGRVVDVTGPIDPVNGKLIDQLVAGERFNVVLPTANDADRELARQLGSLDEEGKVKEIAVSFKGIFYVPGAGYYLYGELPNGMLAKALEENLVRIRQPKAGQASEEQNGYESDQDKDSANKKESLKSDARLYLYMLAALGGIMLVIIIFMLML